MPRYRWAVWLLIHALPALACGPGGCEEWCGEEPNAYFLRPQNDPRANLALLLEEWQLLRFNIDAIPFHYAAFAHGEPEEGNRPEDLATPLNALATPLGLAEVDVAAALERSHAQPEGQCVSNNPHTVLRFWQVLQAANHLPAGDKQSLAWARLKLLGQCEHSLAALPPMDIKSPAGRDYAEYLRAAALFYSGQFDALAEPETPPAPQESWLRQTWRRFTAWLRELIAWFKAPAPTPTLPVAAKRADLPSLTHSAEPWIQETAVYLLGRVYLNQAQQGYNFYAINSKPDHGKLAKARTQFQAYLTRYPQGLYADSARGLFRKIDWLDKNYPAMAREYQEQLGQYRRHAPDPVEILEFINEVANKYQPNGKEPSVWDSPVLAATAALEAMRGDETGQAKPAQDYLPAALKAHQAQLNQLGLGDLGDYLELAYHFYIAKNFSQVLQLTENPLAADTLNPVQFSRLVLRGLAFGGLGQWANAEALWAGRLPRLTNPGQKLQLQWLLAMVWQQQSRLDKLYQQSGPVDVAAIHNYFLPALSQALLESVLGNPQLQAKTREFAHAKLMENLLTHRQYADLLRIHRQYPDRPWQPAAPPPEESGDEKIPRYACPELPKLIAGLAQNPAAPKLLNCYGDQLYQNYDKLPAQWAELDEEASSAHELGDYYPAGQANINTQPTHDIFPGQRFSSLDLYLEVIALPNSKGEAKAYALHQAVNCFARSGYNHCGHQDIPVAQRGAWFRELKSIYPDSPWAQRQKYYW